MNYYDDSKLLRRSIFSTAGSFGTLLRSFALFAPFGTLLRATAFRKTALCESQARQMGKSKRGLTKRLEAGIIGGGSNLRKLEGG